MYVCIHSDHVIMKVQKHAIAYIVSNLINDGIYYIPSFIKFEPQDLILVLGFLSGAGLNSIPENHQRGLFATQDGRKITYKHLKYTHKRRDGA